MFWSVGHWVTAPYVHKLTQQHVSTVHKFHSLRCPSWMSCKIGTTLSVLPHTMVQYSIFVGEGSSLIQILWGFFLWRQTNPSTNHSKKVRGIGGSRPGHCPGKIVLIAYHYIVMRDDGPAAGVDCPGNLAALKSPLVRGLIWGKTQK